LDILDRFIDRAKENVARGYYDVEEEKQEHVSLRKKLLENDFSLISEIKHASPAGEYSYEGIDVDATAKLFKDAGADAISVVVEPQVFKGNLDNIPIAKKTGLPVLFKDFVIDEQQVKAASYTGADAMLLVMKVMDRRKLDVNGFIEKAHSYGLEVLLECYNKDEMGRALHSDADILGINNRDLQTLKVDIRRTVEIMEGADTGGRPLISESGIKTKEDAVFVKKAGARGILVGTALWTADDMYTKIKELRLRD
jgi:indole-3-glycerol phosphate synthase